MCVWGSGAGGGGHCTCVCDMCGGAYKATVHVCVCEMDEIADMFCFTLHVHEVHVVCRTKVNQGEANNCRQQQINNDYANQTLNIDVCGAVWRTLSGECWEISSCDTFECQLVIVLNKNRHFTYKKFRRSNQRHAAKLTISSLCDPSVLLITLIYLRKIRQIIVITVFQSTSGLAWEMLALNVALRS